MGTVEVCGGVARVCDGRVALCGGEPPCQCPDGTPLDPACCIPEGEPGSLAGTPECECVPEPPGCMGCQSVPSSVEIDVEVLVQVEGTGMSDLFSWTTLYATKATDVVLSNIQDGSLCRDSAPNPGLPASDPSGWNFGGAIPSPPTGWGYWRAQQVSSNRWYPMDLSASYTLNNQAGSCFPEGGPGACFHTDGELSPGFPAQRFLGTVNVRKCYWGGVDTALDPPFIETGIPADNAQNIFGVEISIGTNSATSHVLSIGTGIWRPNFTSGGLGRFKSILRTGQTRFTTDAHDVSVADNIVSAGTFEIEWGQTTPIIGEPFGNLTSNPDLVGTAGQIANIRGTRGASPCGQSPVNTTVSGYRFRMITKGRIRYAGITSCGPAASSSLIGGCTGCLPADLDRYVIE